MNFKNLIVLGTFLLVLFVAMGVTTANENTTVNAVELDANEDLGTIDGEYNAKIIAENRTISVDEKEISIKIVDNDSNPIVGAEPFFPEGYLVNTDSDGQYYFAHDLGVGNYILFFSLNDGIYKAKSVPFNLKIIKSKFDGKITCQSYWGTAGDTLTMKATVKDSSNNREVGTVTFKVNGKSYTVKTKSGVATKTIKIKKAGVFTYSATFKSENYKYAGVGKGKLYVYSISKKARTFKIKKNSYVLPVSKYKKLVNAKNTNKLVEFTLKTGKVIKQTYRKYYAFQKYNLKHVKANILFYIGYGGKSGAQGVMPNEYLIRFTTKYQYPDSFCKPSVSGYKYSSQINKLNNFKLKTYGV